MQIFYADLMHLSITSALTFSTVLSMLPINGLKINLAKTQLIWIFGLVLDIYLSIYGIYIAPFKVTTRKRSRPRQKGRS